MPALALASCWQGIGDALDDLAQTREAARAARRFGDPAQARRMDDLAAALLGIAEGEWPECREWPGPGGAGDPPAPMPAPAPCPPAQDRREPASNQVLTASNGPAEPTCRTDLRLTF